MLVSAQPLRVVLIGGVLLFLLIVKGKEYWHASLNMCWRMKWIWLSLLILYGWFIPGTPLFVSEYLQAMYIPSIEGLKMGAVRAAALLSIVSGVVLLMKSTLRNELIVSIIWLLAPLRVLKLNTGLFAARLVLTIEKVTETENQVLHALKASEKMQSVFQRGIDSIASLLIEIEQQATDTPETLVSLPRLDMPMPYQWLIPLILFMGLYVI